MIKYSKILNKTFFSYLSRYKNQLIYLSNNEKLHESLDIDNVTYILIDDLECVNYRKLSILSNIKKTIVLQLTNSFINIRIIIMKS